MNNNGDEQGWARGSKRKAEDDVPAAPGRRLHVSNLLFGTTWQTLKDHFKSAGRVTFAKIPSGADGRPKGWGVVEFETIEEATKALELLNDKPLNGRPLKLQFDKMGSDNNDRGNRPYEPRPYSGHNHPGAERPERGYPPRDVPPSHQPHNPYENNYANKRFRSGEYDGRGRDDRARDGGRDRFIERERPRNYNRPIPVETIPSPGHMAAPPNVGQPSGGLNCRLHVANLPFDLKWQDLKDYFKGCGEVAYASLATDKETGKSKGWGTIVFVRPEDAATAVERLHMTVFSGRKIFVKFDDREQQQQPLGPPHQQQRMVGRESYPAPGQYHHGAPIAGPVHAAEYVVAQPQVMMYAQGQQPHYSQVPPVQVVPISGQHSHGQIGQPGPAPHFVGRNDYTNRGTPGRSDTREVKGTAAMSTRVFVDGLPLSLEWQELKALCESHGFEVLQAECFTDRAGYPKGSGVVGFKHPREAQEAQRLLNGFELQGKILSASFGDY